MRRIAWVLAGVVVVLATTALLCAAAWSATTGWDGTAPVNVAVQGPPSGGGLINIGQAFGWAQPYVDAGSNAVLAIAAGWLWYVLKKGLNLNVDAAHRAALLTFCQNAASSLIADGFVTMSGKTVMVKDGALAEAVNFARVAVPDALAHFGFNGPGGPDKLAAKIVDMIPQTPAGAAIVAAAHAKA